MRPGDEDRDGGKVRALQAERGVPLELPDTVKDPCNECPWRRVAAPGWLGPGTAEEWIETVQSETPIMCHKTCNENHSYEGTSQCRGAAIFRANICKSPRRSDAAVGPEDKETVFANPLEFLEHHNRHEKRGGRDQ